MAGLIIPSAVAALAYKRLRDASAALRDKVTAVRYDTATGFLVRRATDAVVVQPTDRRMLALVEGGRDLMAGGPPAPVPPDIRVGAGIGMFAVLGTTGYEWPGYAEHFTGDPVWRAGAIRRGSPDPDFSQVIVPATQFAIRVGELGRQKTADSSERDQIAAFAGGMLVAAATEIVVGPIARGLRADVSTTRHDRFGPPAMHRGAQQSLKNILGGDAAIGTWQSWWPSQSAVPGALYDGYLAALEETYGFLKTPPGFPSFLDGFQAGDDLTMKRLRSGVSFLTQDLVTAGWGIGHWYLVLTPALLSVPLTLLVGRFLSPADGFLTPDTPTSALGGLQLYSMAAGIASVSPFALQMYLWSQVPEHTEAFVTSLILGIARVGLSIGTVAAAAGGSSGATWALWAIQTLTDLYELVRGLIALGMQRPGDAFVHLIGATPWVFGLTALGFAAIMDALGLDSELGFWLTWVILTVLIMVPGGLLTANALASAGGIGSVFGPNRDTQFPVVEALRAAAAGTAITRPAVFDESTLWRDPAVARATTAALPELRYPTDRKAIVRVWWERAGSLEIAHDEHTVRMRVDGGAITEVVLTPNQMSGLGVAIALDEALVGVSTSLVDPQQDQRLAFPYALADPGDTESVQADHDAHAGDFRPVGVTEETAYLLHTAPRAEVATRAGLAAAPGSPTSPVALVPGPTLADLDDSALGLAADLGAMLVAGASPSLRGVTANTAGLPAIPNAVPGPVYQVFRQWNLDERRLNEWRMLTEGGAVSEKANPADHESGMRRLPPGSPPYLSAVPAGEALLNDMGWIRTWRAWLRVASDITADTSSTTAAPYTPLVERWNGTTVRPTNQDLTDAVRFLFDLP
jgi:hypothetical protein